jgi:ubiquitin carboxyl-terminal hydrolase 1
MVSLSLWYEFAYRLTIHPALNTPNSYRASLQPLDIIRALSSHSSGKHNSLFSSREHQDAQELFQLLSECIKSETADVDQEGHRDRGLGGLTQLGETSREIGKSVFDGLTANRRSCIECGYTEAVMHFAFDNWQLAVPRLMVGPFFSPRYRIQSSLPE